MRCKVSRSEDQTRSTKLSESSPLAVWARMENLGQEDPTMRSREEGKRNCIEKYRVGITITIYGIEISLNELRKSFGISFWM